jgi:hypothetical protein
MTRPEKNKRNPFFYFGVPVVHQFPAFIFLALKRCNSDHFLEFSLVSLHFYFSPEKNSRRRSRRFGWGPPHSIVRVATAGVHTHTHRYPPPLFQPQPCYSPARRYRQRVGCPRGPVCRPLQSGTHLQLFPLTSEIYSNAQE